MTNTTASLALSNQIFDQMLTTSYRVLFGFSFRQGQRFSIEALGARPGERILHVGIDNGKVLARYPKGTSVIGIDAPGMELGKARNRIEKLPPTKLLLNMNIEQMTFVDGCFDKAVLMDGLSGYFSPERAISELRRVCKPGATLVAVQQISLARSVKQFVSRLLGYPTNPGIETMLTDTGLEVLDRRQTDFFGRSSIYVCRLRKLPATELTQPLMDMDLGDTGIALTSM